MTDPGQELAGDSAWARDTIRAGNPELAGFTALPDLAARDLGAGVVFANDELFAEKENLIKPGPAALRTEFGHKGKVYDGWETRRRREPGHDHAIIRLGAPGIVHGVVVDTAYFRGNYPPEISVEAVRAQGYPSPAELAGLRWESLVGRTGARGDAANSYAVSDRRCWTHVRLSIYPDGGVARFRVHGEVLPDPAFLTGTVDLAAMQNGGQVTDCSDAFYSSPAHLILPGQARVMSDGWENARRRGPGHDYVIIRLGAAGRLRHVEIDTSCFVGNAPGWASLSAVDERHAAPSGGLPTGPSGRMPSAALGWREALPETRLQPDTRHRFRLDDPSPCTHVRLDVIPDGGLARLRAYGEIDPDALAGLRRRWQETR